MEEATQSQELEERRKMDREACFQVMDKIFEPVPKFDVSYAEEDPIPDNRQKFSEKDYSVHRKREFPHVYHPLKSLHKKKKKRDHRKRKKKKKHEVKFTPSLPGVEEDDEPDSPVDSDSSSSSLFDYDSDVPQTSTVEKKQPPSEPKSVPRKQSDVPLIQIEPPQDAVPSKKVPAHLGFKPEVGESPTRHRSASDTTEGPAVAIPVVPKPGGHGAKDILDVDHHDHRDKRKLSAELLPSSRRGSDASTGGTPRKSSLKTTDPARLDFLSRKFSETGLPSPISSDSLRSDHLVAAQEFHMQAAGNEPEVSHMFDTDSAPQVSQRIEKVVPDEPERQAPKVKFQLGGDDEEHTDEPLLYAEPPASVELGPVVKVAEEDKDEDEDTEKKMHKKRHHHHKHKKHKYPTEHYNLDDLMERRHAGSETVVHPGLKRVPTEPDEAALLHMAALDNMKSHRFEDVRGIRRHKIRPGAMASIVQISKAPEKRRMSVAPPKKYDHSPHDLFVELDELYVGDHAELEWREKARWIKFEEDVEEGAERWGKPHVASLSFHSLLELRLCVEKCAILLDLEAHDLTSIVSQTVDQLVITDQITEEDRPKVFRALLLKHKHLHDDKKSAASIVKNLSSSSLNKMFSSSSSLKEVKSPHPIPSPSQSDNIISYTKMDEVKVDIDNNTEETISFEVPRMKRHDSFISRQQHDIMKKIPKGAEMTTVLVGAVDFLDKPVMAFIRLAHGQYLGNLTEVPLPVRFMFVLLGPEKGEMDYHEMGRSVSTLMSNKMFHDAAYMADSRQDILTSINVFLDQSIVLPPGEWDRDTLLPLADRKDHEVRQRKKKTKKTTEEAAALIEEKKEERKHPDPLKRTKRFFGGLINEVKFRYPLYWSDIKDGLNMQCIATFVFIYFACLAPAITFGGLLGEKTNGWMGVGEMFVGICACGLIFTFLSGQPLLILGHTGPLLVFEEAVYKFCFHNNLSYMPMRAWIGLWVAVITVIVVMFEGSFLVRYLTRFTEEVFSTLISFIFIYEVFRKLYVIFVNHPLLPYYPGPCPPVGPAFNNTTDAGNGSSYVIPPTADYANSSLLVTNNSKTVPDKILEQPNTALLCVILTFGTFFIANFLRKFRNSSLLGRTARRAIGDFGIPIAIVTMTLIDFFIKDVYTEKLNVPDGIKPTSEERESWFINPVAGIQVWQVFAAILPAALIFILVFMETMISGIIVSKKERKLQKGSSFHLDLFIIGCLNGFCGLFGLPFVTAAHVRTVTHVSALSVYSRTHAPGEKPKLLETKEQRVTNFLVHVLIGVSVVLSPVLKEIPIAVLFGVFLYMGIASMSGITLLNRIVLLLTPEKHHPDVTYVKRVKTRKMHLFTFIQMIWLGMLWAVKSTVAVLGFPFFLVLMVPFRLFFLKFMFNENELVALDTDEIHVVHDTDVSADEEEEEEPDFYEQSHLPRNSSIHI